MQASVCAHCRQASMVTCVFLYTYCLVFCAHVCFALQGCSRIRKERSSTGFNDHLDHQLVQLKLWRAGDQPIVTELLSQTPSALPGLSVHHGDKRRMEREQQKNERGSALCICLYNPSTLCLFFNLSCEFFFVWCNKKPILLPGQSIDLRDLSEQWRSWMENKEMTNNNK